MEMTYRPKALTTDQLRALSQEVKQALTELYGNRLDRVILYGSYGRGDFHAESDVDYMVVLRDKQVNYGAEIRYMSSSIGELSFSYDLFISAKPTSIERYRLSNLLFYNTVRQEGIVL